MDTHLKDFSPLGVRNGRPHVLLPVKACLSLWEIPNHLSLGKFTVQLCRCTKAVNMRNM